MATACWVTRRAGREAAGLRSAPLHRGGFTLLSALGLAGLSVFAAARAHAEVVLDLSPDKVQVKVENDTVGHALDALGRTGSFRYLSTAPLNKAIRGNFSGSLGEVVVHILQGFDFVVLYKQKGVEVLVYGESGATPTGPTRSAASAAGGASAPGNPAPRPLARGGQKFEWVSSTTMRTSR